jgi:hypothetical protein
MAYFSSGINGWLQSVDRARHGLRKIGTHGEKLSTEARSYPQTLRTFLGRGLTPDGGSRKDWARSVARSCCLC